MTALPLPTEAECQTAIIEAAHMFGYRVHHQRPARLADGRIRTTIQGDKGWPCEPVGVWGATTPQERQRLRTRREAA